jgi:hypothetical protein
MLAWYRDLIGLRRELHGEVEMLDAPPGVVAFRRGSHLIALNMGAATAAPPPAQELVLSTAASNLLALAPGGAIVALG